jgi:hypothetical protein
MDIGDVEHVKIVVPVRRKVAPTREPTPTLPPKRVPTPEKTPVYEPA